MVVFVLDFLASLDEDEDSMSGVIVPRTGIGVAIGHGVSGLSMLLVGVELTVILGTSGPGLNSLTMLEVILPLTLVHGLVGSIDELTLAMLETSMELALVLVSRDVSDLTSTVLST